jgi:hypothetical protein
MAVWKSGFGAKVTKNKVRGVVGCGLCFFWQRGSKLYQKTTQRISCWHHFHPIQHRLGAKGDLKINKNNNKLKKCKRKYDKTKNRKFFECVAILSKTGGLNGCTFTVVL